LETCKKNLGVRVKGKIGKKPLKHRWNTTEEGGRVVVSLEPGNHKSSAQYGSRKDPGRKGKGMSCGIRKRFLTLKINKALRGERRSPIYNLLKRGIMYFIWRESPEKGFSGKISKGVGSSGPFKVYREGKIPCKLGIGQRGEGENP